ncbi:hypothetical protein LTR53_019248, partial [Teratosphaeriaceae sp. CCFEE 6253]
MSFYGAEEAKTKSPHVDDGWSAVSAIDTDDTDEGYRQEVMRACNRVRVDGISGPHA